MNMRPDIDINSASRMWADGLSAGVIAGEFGVSRNVVMGIVNRNRDLFPEKKQAKEYKPSAKAHISIDLEQIIPLWVDGMPIVTIAYRFGVTHTAIRTIVKANRDKFPRRDNAAERVWQDSDMAEASRMWKDGSSAAKIAKHFGVNKAAILGIAYRHRDRFPLRNKAGHRATRNSKPMASIMPRTKRNDAPDFGEAEPQIPSTEYDLQRMPHAKTLVDLEPCECKWPLTSGGPFMFCAEATESRSSYCTNHLERSLPARENRRLAA